MSALDLDRAVYRSGADPITRHRKSVEILFARLERNLEMAPASAIPHDELRLAAAGEILRELSEARLTPGLVTT